MARRRIRVLSIFFEFFDLLIEFGVAFGPIFVPIFPNFFMFFVPCLPLFEGLAEFVVHLAVDYFLVKADKVVGDKSGKCERFENGKDATKTVCPENGGILSEHFFVIDIGIGFVDVEVEGLA